jgi:hypothetical protein
VTAFVLAKNIFMSISKYIIILLVTICAVGFPQYQMGDMLYGYRIVSTDSTIFEDYVLVKVYFVDMEKYFILSKKVNEKPQKFVLLEEGQILDTKLEPIDNKVSYQPYINIRSRSPLSKIVYEHDVIFENDSATVIFYQTPDIIGVYVNESVLREDFLQNKD